MTIVNDLIRRASQRPTPVELTINDNQVDGIAVHARAQMNFPKPITAAEIAISIRAGKMRFMEIPVRVLGASDQQLTKEK